MLEWFLEYFMTPYQLQREFNARSYVLIIMNGNLKRKAQGKLV